MRKFTECTSGSSGLLREVELRNNCPTEMTLLLSLPLGRIGIVAGGQWFLAVSDDPSDTAACQRAVEWGLNWMIEPVFGQNGDYPEAMKQAMNASEDEQGFELLPKFSKTEKEELKGQSR